VPSQQEEQEGQKENNMNSDMWSVPDPTIRHRNGDGSLVRISEWPYCEYIM